MMARRGQIHFPDAMNNLSKMQEYIHAGMEGALDIADELMVAADSEESKEMLKELEEVMLLYCRMDRDRKQFLESFDFVKEQAADLGPTDTPDLSKYLDDKLAVLRGENTDADLRQHERFIEYQGKIEQGSGSEIDLPASNVPVDTEHDEEIAVTQQEVNIKCPYTGLEMQYPVRNKHCSHNYDRNGIKQYIKNRGNRAKCPVGGCVNSSPIVMSDLEDNKELKKYIDQKNRASGKRPNKKRT